MLRAEVPLKQILPLLVLVVAAGCSSSSGGGTGPEDAANPDGTVDSSLDASSDALADTSDSSVLSDADAGVDVGVESLDAGTDADTRPDGGVEVGDSGPGGGLQWAENFGLAGYTNANAVALDPSSGDVVVVGYLNPNTSVNFGGGSLANATALSTDYTMFVAKFDSSGKYKWAKTFGNGLDVIAHSVGIDALGNVAIGGNFQGSVNFGGSTLTAAGDFDLFVVKFDAAGSFRWSKSFGAAGKSQVVNSVAVDGAGAVLFSGRGEAVDFGGGAKTGFYLAKLDSTGAHAWSNGFAATSVYSGPWLAVDTAGSAFLAGSFSTTVNFGGGTLTSAGATDAFVAKFDPSGAYQWAKQYGDSKAQSLSGVATDLAGDVFVSGDLTGGTVNARPLRRRSPAPRAGCVMSRAASPRPLPHRAVASV